MSAAYQLKEYVVNPAASVIHFWANMAQAACEAVTDHPFAHPMVRQFYRAGAAACEITGRMTAEYNRPDWMLDPITYKGTKAVIQPRTLPNTSKHNAFINVTHFEREGVDDKGVIPNDPVVLVFAPMSGHYATLLRQTAKDLLASGYNTFITEHEDASRVPLRDASGNLQEFGFEDCVEFYMDAIRAVKAKTGRDVHVMAVCQPGPALATALAIMESEKDPATPRSATFMGSPIDVSQENNAVTDFADKHDMGWFERNAIHTVPFTREGYGRQVYSGVQQLVSFMMMKLDSHIQSHRDLFFDLIKGDDAPAHKQKAFYNEFLAVCDLPGKFYRETVQWVFKERRLAKGTMTYRGKPVSLNSIRRTPILAVGGQEDDITHPKQCLELVNLCGGLEEDQKRTLIAKKVGHYGLFSGTTGWRNQVLGEFAKLVADTDGKPRPEPANDNYARGEAPRRRLII